MGFHISKHTKKYLLRVLVESVVASLIESVTKRVVKNRTKRFLVVGVLTYLAHHLFLDDLLDKCELPDTIFEN